MKKSRFTTEQIIGFIKQADAGMAVTKRAPARSKKQLQDVVIGHLRKLQKSPARVRKYFEHKPVRHAS